MPPFYQSHNCDSQVVSGILIHFHLSVGASLEPRKGFCAEHALSIRLDVKAGPHLRLQDTFSWELSNPDNSPEEFAALLVSDYLHSEKKAVA